MFKNQKGITLIALVITIIVLLILAGVTIAMLTGSDSAPQKANEAKQKQDIGAAKDQVYIAASNLQMKAYNDVYVEGKQAGTSVAVSKANQKTNIGTYVGTNISVLANGGIDASKKVGDATIEFFDKTTGTNFTKSANNTDTDVPTTASGTASKYIKISTTDFETIGWITAESGVLTWTTKGIVEK